jgi:hypothetical protein
MLKRASSANQEKLGESTSAFRHLALAGVIAKVANVEQHG